MRKLIILRGAMGCGKSTFIKENDLERFTLSADAIRLMYNSPELTSDYQLLMSIYKIVQKREFKHVQKEE